MKMEMTRRQIFIEYFFSCIKGYRYALLKYISPSYSDIPESSDIDILIQRSDISFFLQLIGSAQGVTRVQLREKNFATFVHIYFDDQSFIEIDLIHRFDRKGIVYLDAEAILNNVLINKEGLQVPSPEHHFEYIMLFYLLNNSDVDGKYVDHFDAYPQNLRNNIFGYIRSKYELVIHSLDDLLHYELKTHEKISGIIFRNKKNRGLRKVFNRLTYVIDTLRDLLSNKGTIITFSGVDGAGKSTVLEHVKQILQKKYRYKIVVIRHRPSLLPIISAWRYGKQGAEERSLKRLPRQGKNNNHVSSFFRFAYYYTDYLLGQFYIYFKYIRRGYTVLYDRYYFDFIVDAKRTNINLSKRLLKGGYSFIFKPSVNVFLYADPETILRRKQELAESDIEHLTKEYMELFTELGEKSKTEKYLMINNHELQSTLDTVMMEFLNNRIRA